ncbi:glycosyltransferase [Clostridium minihomine]|uniref:glycosyltransferase n=1 Tax=Clostridium minihomine TaxID=2045012 RepID=UPI000C777A98|nr:glycosyltransferase [Clostridium minihomine]
MPDQIVTKDPKISIIIPVYNVEPFVGKCLSTLVHQTFQDFEIIAVNDGSKDGSLEILRYFERKYSHITVIDQPNAGMSMARNRGMEQARGEYLCFVDSDDYVSPYFLEELYRAVTTYQADIACCYYYYHFVRSDVLYKYPFRCHGVFDRDTAMNKLLHDTQIQSLVWNKIYKRSLFTEHGITFPTMAFEDLATANRLFSHANKVVVIDKALYYYSQQSTSTLATINADKINDFIYATAMVRSTLEHSGVYRDYEKAYRALCRKTCMCCVYYVLKMHLREKKGANCLSNLKRVHRGIRYCSSKPFTLENLRRHMPDVAVCPPALKKNYSTR